MSPRQQEGDGLVCVEEGRRVGRRGAKEGVGDTRVRSMLVMFEQWTVMGMEWMEAAQEKGHGFPRLTRLAVWNGARLPTVNDFCVLIRGVAPQS